MVLEGIEPVLDKIIFKEEKEEYGRRLFVPEHLLGKRCVKGVVVASGKGYWSAKGVFFENPIKVGMRIIVDREHVHKIMYRDEEYFMTTSYYVLGVVKN